MTKMLPFSNRVEAGRLLALKLKAYEGDPDLVVVALPRGGVPVGFDLARTLRAPLDIIVVRKLGVPWQPDLAMGAVASGGISILNDALIRSLKLSKYYIYNQITKEEQELERREAIFRDRQPARNLSARIVILVDDGAATGATMLAATRAVLRQRPKEIVIALPVGSREARAVLEAETGNCICLATPEPFLSVSQYYRSFPQVTDEEVKELLLRSAAYSETRSVLSATTS